MTPQKERVRKRRVWLFFLRSVGGGLAAMSGLWLAVDALVGATGLMAHWGSWARDVVQLWVTFFLLGLVGWSWGKLARGRRHDVWGQVNEALRRIAQGDFSVQVTVPGQHRDGPENPLQTLATNLNAMTEALSRMEDLRRQFVADVSHEFQSPLTSILGFAQALQADGLPDDLRRRYLGIIETESRRLSRLAEGLLRLNSLEDRDGPPDPSPFRLDVQIRRVLVALEPQWSAKGLEIDADLAATEVTGNEELWTQVWTNLVHNAVKFTLPGGKITVRIVAGPPLAVEVEDTGIGLAPGEADRVFERFYKAESARTHADGATGSGLGLALVHRIVTLHGARVEALSPGPGRGTVVRVSFPPPGP